MSVVAGRPAWAAPGTEPGLPTPAPRPPAEAPDAVERGCFSGFKGHRRRQLRRRCGRLRQRLLPLVHTPGLRASFRGEEGGGRGAGGGSAAAGEASRGCRSPARSHSLPLPPTPPPPSRSSRARALGSARLPVPAARRRRLAQSPDPRWRPAPPAARARPPRPRGPARSAASRSAAEAQAGARASALPWREGGDRPGRRGCRNVECRDTGGLRRPPRRRRRRTGSGLGTAPPPRRAPRCPRRLVQVGERGFYLALGDTTCEARLFRGPRGRRLYSPDRSVEEGQIRQTCTRYHPSRKCVNAKDRIPRLYSQKFP
ncbi:uncharacterized protein AAES06_002844 [Glossophaga mutica]